MSVPNNTWLGQCPLGCHAVLWCFTTIPAGGLGVAPLCLRCPPGYLKTHIIHSFLTILNYKTVRACLLPSWIYCLFLISLRRLNFHNAPLVRKTLWKDVFNLHGSQIERGYITMRHTTSLIVMYAWLLTETESQTVWILIRRSLWIFQLERCYVAFKNTTLPGAIVIWWFEIVVFSVFVLSDAQT